MSPTRLAIARPITTLMACLIVVLLGVMALKGLSVDLMPDLEFPTVTVTTLYPGAGPEEIETLVTRPLEESLSGVTGFERLSSTSLEGSSSIRVQFRWGIDLDAAVADLRQAIDKVRNRLPDQVDAPVIRQYDANSSPIMYLGLSGDLTPARMTQMAERTILPRLEQLPGVARVGIRGSVQREIQVSLNRAKLESLGMGVNEVVNALQQENISRPGGRFQQGEINVLLRSRGDFRNLDEIRNVVVRHNADTVIRVGDVADVSDGIAELTELTRVNAEPGLMIYVFQQSGANTIDVSDAVQEAVAKLKDELTEGTLNIRLDKSDFIRQSISNIRESAIYGMGLAMIVLLLFLGSVRSTLLIAISMPLSVLATFVLIYFQGFSLNMVSFGGLALGMGMLVDNSIVVLESVFRKREEGLSETQAALEGTEEVAGAITASTLTTLIVFLPLIFIQGMTGVLLHQLAYVVSFSLLTSLISSLTLTPVLAAYWLGRQSAQKDPKSLESTADSVIASPGRRLIEGGLAKLVAIISRGTGIITGLGRWILTPFEIGYSKVLSACLSYPEIAVIPLLIAAAACIGLIPRVGSDFLPATEDGRLGVTGTMSAGIQLEALQQQTLKVEKILADAIPETVGTSVFIGDEASDGADWNQSRFIIQLSPRSERTRSADEIRRKIVKQIGPVAGMTINARVYNPLPMSRMFSSQEGDSLTVFIRGHDRATADDLAAEVMRQMKEVDGISNAELRSNKHRPELMIRVDHDKAALLGIRVRDITEAVETTIRGTVATVFREGGDEFDILVRLREEDRSTLANIGDITVATPTGKLVPLSNLVSLAPGDAPLSIDRLDRQRVLVVSATVDGRDLGAVVADLKERLTYIPVPEGFTINVGGDYEQQQESFVMLRNGFLLAVLLMYMIMASQFESLRDPLLILFSLPMAGVGVILVLVYWNTTLNVQSFIGLIVLAGIAVNNAIVLVDYANQLKLEHPETPIREIIHRAALRRFRPIVMTTLTTVLAMIPVAIGLGEGGELQSPMARVVIGGLFSATLMTLVLIPILIQFVTRQPTSPPRPA
ncbi:MAG: efflux RND transporter permease subunit [Planctomycetaceae bacterium]